jgi:hypothetical protein
LRESESTSLDFKRAQYRFVGASDNEKSELLKDILAFVNSWRHADAYILIGVDEQSNNSLVGVSTHFDDATLQQFVNSKTHRPMTFSYETVVYQGKEVDVIRIPQQERPVYLRKDFGSLKKETVYIRRGSSTDIASPSEIAEMGKASISGTRTPTLRLEFVDPLTSKSLGTSLHLISTIVEYDDEDIPGYSTGQGLFATVAFHENRNYYHKLAAHIRTIEFFKPFKLRVVSTSGELAEDVVLVLDVNQQDVKFSCDKYASMEPARTTLHVNFRPINYKTSYSVSTSQLGSTLNVEFGNVRPKASSNPPGYFSAGSRTPTMLHIGGHLYGNNIPEPIGVGLDITIDVRHRELSFEELRDYKQKK